MQSSARSKRWPHTLLTLLHLTVHCTHLSHTITNKQTNFDFWQIADFSHISLSQSYKLHTWKNSCWITCAFLFLLSIFQTLHNPIQIKLVFQFNYVLPLIVMAYKPVTQCLWFHSTFSLDLMMTSSNGNSFRVTGHLCGEFTGPDEFPAQRPVTRSLTLIPNPSDRLISTMGFPILVRCHLYNESGPRCAPKLYK